MNRAEYLWDRPLRRTLVRSSHYSAITKTNMEAQKKPSEIPSPDKSPEVKPVHIPESPLLPEEEPEHIPEEEPMPTPHPEIPLPGKA